MEKEWQSVLIELENLKMRVGHIESTTESEKGSRKRATRFLIQEIDRIKAKVEAMMSGDEKSLFVKVDRLEQRAERGKKFEWLAISEGVAILAKVIWDYFSKK